MGKKGWWRQLQSDDYPETQVSYGQDMRALKGETTTGESIGVIKDEYRLPSKKIYNPEYLRGQKRRPFKHFTNSKPISSRSINTDHKFKPTQQRNKNSRNITKVNRLNGEETEVICLKCGHRKKITFDFIKRILPKMQSISDKGLALFMRRIKGRLKCSNCGSKNINIITNKKSSK